MRAHRIAAFAVFVLSLLAVPAFADGSFVKIGDIKGTATESQHFGWIPAGLWGTEARAGKWFWSKPVNVFWFETGADNVAIQKAVIDKVHFDRVLLDVSIKGDVLRTTFSDVRIIADEPSGKFRKITLQFKKQTDQRVTFTAAR
jgi:hypothetical protein